MKLKKIDLRKSNGHNHPDIKPGRQWYLAKINGELYAGRFTREWYGLNFDGWHYGLQFDEPDTNSSSWQALWAIVR